GRFGLVRLEVQRDARAGCLALGRLERELAAAVGAPAPGLAAPGAARDDLDARGDQEARVEADAELADQLGRRRAARLADLLEEGLGARARDRAQVRDQLVVAHAHAAVVHAQRARLGIELEPDARLGLGRGELGLRQRLEAALVERVAGVRDQLAQEDLAVPVEGVDHQAEDFAGLGLETQGLARLAHGGDHSGHRRGLCKPGRALGSGVELRSPWDRNPSAALGFAALVGLPRDTSAYALLGGSLGLDQRDVRVFDNFSDPEAHSNTHPDPDYPGALGPTLAIWKAAVEWGSGLHGTGLGDPMNPDGLGSGGADFDFSWQGPASAVGGPDDNTVSEIAGSGGAVFAFCEAPISDGWRIRFYADAAVWHDAPGAPPNGPADADIQG